ncbi:MAG: hypothetical protein BMS9Abin12_1441 [Acidimicrobiia bacterium]|nr:MAG: hypothetical protein BMS9Abin12_1441 [Acidimicrobiia bacterium]
MGTYRLACEFDIVRRIGWTDEELGEHIDAVFEILHQADVVRGIEAGADLDSGRARVSMTLSTFDEDPLHFGCAIFGVAIRSCGGEHVGLLPLGEEGVLRPERNQWSGLRTPTWRVRQKDFDDTPPDTYDGTLG